MKKRLVKFVCVLLSVLTVFGWFAFQANSSRAMAEENAADGKRVYFAAPLFNEAEREDKQRYEIVGRDLTVS